MMMRAVLLIASMLVVTPAAAKPLPARPAKVIDWTRVANATAAGAFIMGNPAAKVRLVEYGSLTCSHCRHFDEEGATPLVANFVRGGRVAWEFRPFLLNGYDMPATLTAGCNGAQSFFPMMRSLYATQASWVAKMQAIPADRLAAIRKLAPAEQFAAIGTAAGFPAFGAAHGIPAAKISACLRNQAAADKAIKLTTDSVNQDQVRGTPTFVINGATVDYSSGTSPWATVEAQLKSTLAKVSR